MLAGCRLGPAPEPRPGPLLRAVAPSARAVCRPEISAACPTMGSAALVIEALYGCVRNSGKNFWVGTGKRQELSQKAGEINSEWLYDFTCIEYDGDWLKRALLVAECEWGNECAIDYDFRKLLLVRADVRMMIFNGNYYRVGRHWIESDGFGKFLGYIDNYKHTQAGDTYLFAARLHDSEDGRSVDHRLQFLRVEVSESACIAFDRRRTWVASA